MHKNYLTLKEKARQEAIEWQYKASEENYSYSELYDFQSRFERLAKKYGLINEFKENGII